MANEPSQAFKDFTGINNIDAEERLGEGDLREAVNVDIERSKRVRRRKGFALVKAGNYHSLFSGVNEDGQQVLIAGKSGALVQFNTDFSETTLASGFNPGKPWSFVEVNGIFYGSNGETNGKLREGAWVTWGLPPPAYFPAVTFGTGSFPAGIYHFAVTYKTTTGLESAPVFGRLNTTVTGGMTMNNIPVSSHPDVATVCVYMTAVNGSEYYLAGTVNNGVSSLFLQDTHNTIPLRTQYLQAPPPGTMVRYHFGRIYIVDGSALWFTGYHDYEHVDFRANYLLFKSSISIVESVQGQVGTLWVVADKSYALIGQEPEKMQRIIAADYGGVPGSGVVVPAEKLPLEGQQGQAALWTSAAGICAGLDNGLFINLTKDKYIPNQSSQAAALFRGEDGMEQYLAVLKNPGRKDGFYASDRHEATIVRAYTP